MGGVGEAGRRRGGREEKRWGSRHCAGYAWRQGKVARDQPTQPANRSSSPGNTKGEGGEGRKRERKRERKEEEGREEERREGKGGWSGSDQLINHQCLHLAPSLQFNSILCTVHYPTSSSVSIII